MRGAGGVGITHTFRNASTAPARFLNFNTPGGFEHYIRDLAAAAAAAGGGPTPPEVLGAIGSRYDMQVVR